MGAFSLLIVSQPRDLMWEATLCTKNLSLKHLILSQDFRLIPNIRNSYSSTISTQTKCLRQTIVEMKKLLIWHRYSIILWVSGNSIQIEISTSLNFSQAHMTQALSIALPSQCQSSILCFKKEEYLLVEIVKEMSLQTEK